MLSVTHVFFVFVGFWNCHHFSWGDPLARAEICAEGNGGAGIAAEAYDGLGNCKEL